MISIIHHFLTGLGLINPLLAIIEEVHLIVEEDHCDQKCVKCRPTTSDDGWNGQPDYVRCSTVTVDNASQAAAVVSLHITEFNIYIHLRYARRSGEEEQ